MRKKTYFTQFLIASFVAILFACLSIGLFVANGKKATDKQTNKPSVQTEATVNETRLTKQRKTTELFLEDYFNYSSDNYKERVPKLKEVTTKPFLEELSRNFDDMFIEKGYQSKLESSEIYQSVTDEETVFVTVTITYEMNGTTETQTQTAVLSIQEENEQFVISSLKFIQRPEG